MFSLVQQEGTENLVSYVQESTLSSCDNKAVFSSVAHLTLMCLWEVMEDKCQKAVTFSTEKSRPIQKISAAHIEPVTWSLQPDRNKTSLHITTVVGQK